MASGTRVSRWPRWQALALLSSALLPSLFQGCASSPKPAEAPEQPRPTPAPPPQSDPAGETAVGSSPEPTTAPDERRTEPPIASADSCGEYAGVQGLLAELGAEALGAGRIDPWLYGVDAKTGELRLNRPAGLSPERTARLQSALKRANANRDAAKTLAAAHAELTQPGQCTVCTPTSYEIKVQGHADPKTKGQWYTWTYGPGPQPSELQMFACFRGLYADVPKGCDISSFAVAEADCLVTRAGDIEPRDCEPEAPESLQSKGPEQTGEESARGCNCLYCGEYVRKKRTDGPGCRSC
jgi:hypothetical protein